MELREPIANMTGISKSPRKGRDNRLKESVIVRGQAKPNNSCSLE
jgi:hypothetical protein